MSNKGLNFQKLRTAITDLHTCTPEHIYPFVSKEDAAAIRMNYSSLKHVLDNHQQYSSVDVDVVTTVQKVKTPEQILDELGVQ